MKKYNICKYCVMERGINGSDLEKNNLETDEDLANHIEKEHNIPVQRKKETDKECMERFYKKYPEAKDRKTCKCPECKENRKRGIFKLISF